MVTSAVTAVPPSRTASGRPARWSAPSCPGTSGAGRWSAGSPGPCRRRRSPREWSNTKMSWRVMMSPSIRSTSVRRGDPAGAVTEPGLVDDQVDRGGHLLADRAHRQVHAGHQHHGLHAGQGVARAVRVEGTDRAVVAGVHGLEHVERGGVADLTDDDAVGTHTQAVLDQVADGDHASTLDVGRAGLEAHHVVLLELELRGVLDGDDALVLRDERRQHVEGRGLSGAGAPGHDDVEPAADAGARGTPPSAR